MLSFLVSELRDDFGRTWPRDTKSSVPETELSVGAVHVASFAFQTLVVTNEQVILLSQFVHQLPNGNPCTRFFSYHQGFEFVDVACCTTFRPDVCMCQRQTFGRPDSDAFRLFDFAFQLQVKVQSFSRLLSHHVYQRICKHVVEADLVFVITDGPASSKCDLTLMTSVAPLRSSISWNKIDHKSPLGPCSKSLLCVMLLVTYVASIGIWIFDFPSTRPIARPLEPSVCLVPGLSRNQYVST